MVGLAGLVADGVEDDSSAFADDPSDFTAPALKPSSTPFTPSAFSILSDAFKGSVVAIYASPDAVEDERLVIETRQCVGAIKAEDKGQAPSARWSERTNETEYSETHLK